MKETREESGLIPSEEKSEEKNELKSIEERYNGNTQKVGNEKSKQKFEIKLKNRTSCE